MKEKLAKIRDWFALTKFRFDIGISFLTLVNFSLLIIAASDKIQSIWPISTLQMGLILVPLAIFGTWFFGYLLDKVAKYQHSYFNIAHTRSPPIMEILAETKEIKKQMEDLKKR